MTDTVRRARKSYASYDLYISKVRKQVHPDEQMSSTAMKVMNDILSEVFDTLHTAMDSVMKSTPNKKTLTHKEAQTAVKLTFTGELAKHAVSEGAKAVTRFEASAPAKKAAGAKATRAKAKSRTDRAGLMFSVGRVDSALRKIHKHRVSPSCSVFMAAALEYICAEILELAGNAARDNKSVRITPRYITLAVRGDEELDVLVKSTIGMGGVIPHIAKVLLPKKAAAAAAPAKKKK